MFYSFSSVFFIFCVFCGFLGASDAFDPYLFFLPALNVRIYFSPNSYKYREGSGAADCRLGEGEGQGGGRNFISKNPTTNEF